MQFEIAVMLIAYLFVVFGLPIYVMRRRSTGNPLSEYFLGSRSMGGFVLAMTLTATYINVSSLIGGPGAVHRYELGWVLLTMTQVPTIWFSLGILGKEFMILARRYNVTALNDMLQACYQSRAVVWIASVSLLVVFVGAIAMQFIGDARPLGITAGIKYETDLLIFGITTALYTAFDGFRASMFDNMMQGMVMLIGMIVLLIGVVHVTGDLHQAVDTLQRIGPQLVSPHGADDILSPAFMTSFWMLVRFGVIGLPHTAVHCISYKDSKAVYRGIVTNMIVVAILMFGMYLADVLDRAILPSLIVPSLMVPMLTIQVLPPWTVGLFLAAPMAAIMSSVNTYLLQASTVVIKDLWLGAQPTRKRNEQELERISTIATLVSGILMMLAARRSSETTIWLNLLAFGGLGAMFL